MVPEGLPGPSASQTSTNAGSFTVVRSEVPDFQATAHLDLGQSRNQALLEKFIHIYEPDAVGHDSGSTLTWMKQICATIQLSNLQRVALHALAGSIVALSTDNDLLKAASHVCYGQALQELHRRLNQGESGHAQELLTAIRCLMIYEVRGLFIGMVHFRG